MLRICSYCERKLNKYLKNKECKICDLKKRKGVTLEMYKKKGKKITKFNRRIETLISKMKINKEYSSAELGSLIGVNSRIISDHKEELMEKDNIIIKTKNDMVGRPRKYVKIK